MRKRTARKLRRIADRLDPKPARWYQVTSGPSTWQQSGNILTTGPGMGLRMHMDLAPPKRRHRVLADYLTTMDLKKLRP